MSWFKTDSSGEPAMNNVSPDSRVTRATSPDTASNNLDLKMPPRPSSSVRTDTKPMTDGRPAPDSKAAAAQETGVSVLGATLQFKGELRADEDFVLQGRVEGSIHHSQNLTIGTDGSVKGDSRALTIVVEGTIEGDLYALESISLRPTAKVQGNLLAPRVSIADGACFNGKVDMASATRAVRKIERHAPVTADAAAAEQLLLAAEHGQP
jgi:cytoskeletal protein CcmA (bactofilin family)